MKAVSEEHGETHIHSMNSHLRDSNYGGDNLSNCWIDTSAAEKLFEAMQVPSSHRVYEKKSFDINKASALYLSIQKNFSLFFNRLHSDLHRPFIASTSGFRSHSPRSNSFMQWHYLTSSDLKSKLTSPALNRIRKLHNLLFSSIDAATWNDDLDWAED